MQMVLLNCKFIWYKFIHHIHLSIKQFAMKKNIILLMCAVFSGITFGQVNPHIMIDEIVVSPPKFIGEANNLTRSTDNHSITIQDYLVKNFRRTALRNQALVEGVELVEFLVLPTGDLTDLIIINGVSPEIDAEIIRILKTTNGMWFPGSNSGVPIAMKKEISLKIKVAGSENSFTETARLSQSKAVALFYEKGKPQRALKYYDQSIRYYPRDISLLQMRGLCKYELGDREGANEDWTRVYNLSGLDFADYYLAIKP